MYAFATTPAVRARLPNVNNNDFMFSQLRAQSSSKWRFLISRGTPVSQLMCSTMYSATMKTSVPQNSKVLIYLLFIILLFIVLSFMSVTCYGLLFTMFLQLQFNNYNLLSRCINLIQITKTFEAQVPIMRNMFMQLTCEVYVVILYSYKRYVK